MADQQGKVFNLEIGIPQIHVKNSTYYYTGFMEICTFFDVPFNKKTELEYEEIKKFAIKQLNGNSKYFEVNHMNDSLVVFQKSGKQICILKNVSGRISSNNSCSDLDYIASIIKSIEAMQCYSVYQA